MELLTKVDNTPSKFKISHRDKILMLGSCFIENIGGLLLKSKFDVNLNPFGIVYNPHSMAQVVSFMLGEKEFTRNDIFQANGLFHSFYHHSRFSDVDADTCFANIQWQLAHAQKIIKETSVLILTFGTAYTYTHKMRNSVVGNCHKLPASDFNRAMMSVDEMVQLWQNAIHQLLKVNPQIKIIFTVSPIRHLKDGAHANQLSKATLLLGVDQLIQQFDAATYFASYEIVLDELRDYRFYNDDMVHPSSKAIAYIWKRFSETYFTDETDCINAQWAKLDSALRHRPFNETSAEHQLFLKQIVHKIENFAAQHPFIACSSEIQHVKDRLI